MPTTTNAMNDLQKDNSIKPIETRYKGYRFRSRLEARWAVFFDALGIEWQYEPEGYVLEDGTWYLPDFWLPQIGKYVEVKGGNPTGGEQDKCGMLARATGKDVWLTFGDIPYPGPDNASGYIFPSDGGWDCYYWFTSCHMCGQFDITFGGRGARVKCGCDHSGHGNGDKCYNSDDPRIMEAYAIARSARFEHGEVGR